MDYIWVISGYFKLYQRLFGIYLDYLEYFKLYQRLFGLNLDYICDKKKRIFGLYLNYL